MKKFITIVWIILGSIGLWYCKKDNNPTAPFTNLDLMVTNMAASRTTVAPSDTITLTTTIRNVGDRSSTNTTLRWYRSTDSNIDTNDTLVETNTLSSLAAGNKSNVSILITVTNAPGTYYYYACVDGVTGESGPNDNCSSVVRVVVSAPDLMVTNMMTSRPTVALSNMITLTATVKNVGDRSSTNTTLRWYRSTDSTLDTNDILIETNTLSSLAADGRHNVSISITVTNAPGTHYYYVCVDSVTGEYDTNNNCSSAVSILILTKYERYDDGIPEALEAPGKTFLDLPLYDWGARSNLTDIFVYVVFMNSTDPGIQPQKGAFDMVREAFARRNIAVHFDLGNKFHPGEGISLAHYDLSDTDHTISYRRSITFDDVYVHYSNRMPPSLTNLFYFMVLGSSQNPDGSPGPGGRSQVGGPLSLISLGNLGLRGNSATNIQAITIMHELGHNLGLRHGGNEKKNYKPNYYSVMNYLYIQGLPQIGNQDYDRYFFEYDYPGFTDNRKLLNNIYGNPANFRIDYSDGIGGNLDENHFDESTGLLNRRGSSPVDLNRNGSSSDILSINLNSSYDSFKNVLTDYDDWNNLVFYFARRNTASGLSFFNPSNTQLIRSSPLSEPCCPYPPGRFD